MKRVDSVDAERKMVILNKFTYFTVGENGCTQILENVEEGYCFAVFTGGLAHYITDYLDTV